jgi:hypothetical protein
LSLLYLDLLQAFEASAGSEATLRERQLIEVMAERIERLERDIYWLRDSTSGRPEAGR